MRVLHKASIHSKWKPSSALCCNRIRATNDCGILKLQSTMILYYEYSRDKEAQRRNFNYRWRGFQLSAPKSVAGRRQYEDPATKTRLKWMNKPLVPWNPLGSWTPLKYFLDDHSQAGWYYYWSKVFHLGHYQTVSLKDKFISVCPDWKTSKFQTTGGICCKSNNRFSYNTPY